MKITLPAERLAPTWLNVWQATASTGGLEHTLQVDIYEGTAVRLAATDSTLLLHGLITVDELDTGPSDDEAPDLSLRIVDEDQRAKALMAYLAKVTGDKDYMPGSLEVTLRIESLEAEDQPTLDPSMARQGLIIDAGTELVSCQISDLPFPNWRKLDDVFDVAAIDATAWAPKMLARLGKLTGAVEMDFSGKHKAARLTVRTDPIVYGYAMPLRREADAE